MLSLQLQGLNIDMLRFALKCGTQAASQLQSLCIVTEDHDKCTHRGWIGDHFNIRALVQQLSSCRIHSCFPGTTALCRKKTHRLSIRSPCAGSCLRAAVPYAT